MIADLRSLLARHRAILLTACALALVLGLIKARRQSRLYVAVGVIQIPGGRVSLADVEEEAASGPTASFIQEASTLKDDRILNLVISELRLDDNSTFLQIPPPTHPNPEQQAELRDRALVRLRAALDIQIVRDANLLRLSLESRDPKLAAAIVNRVIDDFSEGRYKFRFEQAQQATEFMRPRLDALATQVQQQQLELLRLQRQLGSTGFASRQNQGDTPLRQLVDEEVRAHLARIAAQVKLHLLESGAGDLPAPASLRNLPGPIAAAPAANDTPDGGAADTLSPSTSLRLALAAAQQQAALLSATLGPRHPDLLAVTARAEALQSSLDLERRSLLAAAAADNTLAALRQRQLDADLEQHTQNNVDLASVALEHNNGQRAYLFSRALYLRFLWRLRIAAIEKAYNSADVTVLDRASIHLSQTVKPRWVFVARYLAFALAGAALVILRLERHTGSLHQRLEVLESVTGLKVIGTTPFAEGLAERLSVPDLIAATTAEPSHGRSQPESRTAWLQSIFDLRALLQLPVTPQSHGRTILFTSAASFEGRTTLSTGFAAVMARNGRRVLLIDADLRKPSVRRVLRLPGRLGLTSVLNGKSSLAESVQPMPGIPTLDVLGSGPIPPETTKLLSSAPMRQLLRQAAATYDEVVIDSPPVLAVTDTLLIAYLADAVVWVVKDRKVGEAGLLRARSLLENAGAPVVGLAVNSVEYKPPALSNRSSPWDHGLFQRFRRA